MDEIEVTLGVLSSKLDTIIEDIHEIKQEIAASRAERAAIQSRLMVGANQFENLQRQIDDHAKRIVTVDQFEPVKRLVYGIAGLILSGFFMWLIAQAFR